MADSAVGAVQVAKGAVAEKRAAAVVAARATGRVLAEETVMVVGERVAAATNRALRSRCRRKRWQHWQMTIRFKQLHDLF